jgi:hypothetical protein
VYFTPSCFTPLFIHQDILCPDLGFIAASIADATLAVALNFGRATELKNISFSAALETGP